MQGTPHAGRIFLTLFLVLAFHADPMLEISTVRYTHLARAVAEEGRFAVDSFAHASRGDLSEYGGHLYPSVLPGLGLALVPFAGLAALLAPLLDVRPNLMVHLVSLILFQVPIAAGAAIVMIRILSRLGLPHGRAVLFALAATLGTPLFIFTTKLSDYPLVTLVQLIAVECLVVEPAEKRATTGRALLVGGCLGICIAVNDMAALSLALVTLAITLPESPAQALRRWGLAIAGAAPCVAARFLYLDRCFGSPFATPLSHSAARISFLDRYGTHWGWLEGVKAILGESPAALFGLTFGEVGLFVFAPVFLLLFVSFRRDVNGAHSETARRVRRAVLLAGAVNLLLHLPLIGGIWRGGASWGPRYMLFSTTLLIIAVALGTRSLSWKAVTPPVLLSIFVNWLGAQYGYNTSPVDQLGLFLLGGPTTPAFRMLWLHWGIVPSPERIALVMEETPRLGAYYAFTHPTPMAAGLMLALVLLALWWPLIKTTRISIT